MAKEVEEKAINNLSKAIERLKSLKNVRKTDWDTVKLSGHNQNL